jgi:uncharacterized zinc-type alcohol dehydrogenase-like protein
MVGTYNSADPHLGGVTYGGYSAAIVIDERSCCGCRTGLDLAAAAPLLCAGITTYSPLRHWKVGEGHKRSASWASVGWATWASSSPTRFGAHTVVFTTSPGKARTPSARRARGGDLDRRGEMAKHAGSFDFILDTVSAMHDSTRTSAC